MRTLLALFGLALLGLVGFLLLGGNLVATPKAEPKVELKTEAIKVPPRVVEEDEEEDEEREILPPPMVEGDLAV